MRPRALSGLIFTRQILPPLVEELGGGNVVLLADAVAVEHLPRLPCAWEIYPVPDDRIAKNAALRLLLPRVARRHRVDVVYVPEGPLIGAPLDVPVVSTLHSHLHFSRPQGMWLPRRIYWELWANGIYRRDSLRSAALIGPTAAFAREFEDIVPGARGRMRAVHHGVSPAFGPGIGARATPPVVLFVGNDMVYKNLAGALRIFARAGEGLPHEMRVAGVDVSRVRRLAREAGAGAILPRVRALGPLDEERLSLEYRAASSLLVPSLVESFGLPVLEAMASGVPVACSDLPSLREVAGGAALHAAPADEPGFAAALRGILCDPATAARLSELGLSRARAFSWARAARETAAIIDEAGRRGHGIL